MRKLRIVVALGGNAILTDDASANAQKKVLKETAEYLIPLITAGHQVIISHGNGPQVGNLVLQQEAAHSDKNPAMPLHTCVAMTQGSIGYWLQNALDEALLNHQLQKETATIVTQVIVDKNDTAFQDPTKPIGPFLTETEMQEEKLRTKAVYKEDAGRGYRKVVPSPKPIAIKEYPVIAQLIANDVVTISAGGGGIPVIQEGNEYVGIEAVIDKDFAAATLAEAVQADQLIILTGVSHVAIRFNQPDQKELQRVTTSELEAYKAENHFAKGSMLPKIEAAIQFVRGNPHGKAVITSLENLPNLLTEGAGTVITR